MFDDLRDMSEETERFEKAPERSLEAFEARPAGSELRIFGMTTVQRFVLSLLLFATVFVLGLMCLMITEKIWLF